ncbi:Cystathionine beta-synthase, core [Ascosphaera apis ARSEF 7405]|uniref:Cystathionine beta-synthase, core n=1 Tax=Ascosphaera apis ARSEF 7405 TaxID=392613 RepID=A0A167UXF2_9EURO|nr:Cystathionine beta-synthase, core [Ascosphaera apis ARSEF 7405]
MKYVFTLSRDAVLDEKTMDYILSAGYSRIPIHSVDNPLDFEGMLLVKTLITYDPEDAMQVKEFALATLPETKPDTSCLDILNYFQEGQSHMVLVSEDPTGSTGALGVVTLEDVMEELIGEEIIDESDIYIDNTSRIRRKPPSSSSGSIHPEVEARATRLSRGFSTFAKNLRLQRAFSAGAAHDSLPMPTPTPLNNAMNPKSTRYGNVKIKQRQQNQLGEREMAKSVGDEIDVSVVVPGVVPGMRNFERRHKSDGKGDGEEGDGEDGGDGDGDEEEGEERNERTPLLGDRSNEGRSRGIGM